MMDQRKNGTGRGSCIPNLADAVQNPNPYEGVSMSAIVQPNVFTALVRAGSYRDRLGNKQEVSVGVTESGGIEITLPGGGKPLL